MMLMTKFGKFKLRLIATIHMSVLLSIFNIASTCSNYWIKYEDQVTNDFNMAGLWRSCNNDGNCRWRDGMIAYPHSLWSLLVRILITLGTSTNVLVVLYFLMALIYKVNKRSRSAIKMLEFGNIFLLISFISIMIGFCIFASTNVSYSMWLLVLSMIIIIVSSNMLTRTFAVLYFQNTRLVPCSKSVEAALSQSKMALDAEEKIALTAIESNDCANGSTNIEMSKVSEANGSNEALIPSLNTVNEMPTVVAEINETEKVIEQGNAEIAN